MYNKTWNMVILICERMKAVLQGLFTKWSLLAYLKNPCGDSVSIENNVF